MSENTKIEWCDATFNPWIGCAKVSPGCASCYAETLMDTRYGRVKWGKGNPRKRTSAAIWKFPLKWNNTAICSLCGNIQSIFATAGNLGKCRKCHEDTMRSRRVFCASLADWLDDEVPIEWTCNLLETIHATQNLDWLMLTKRPERWIGRLEAVLKFAFDNEMTENKRHEAFFDWINFWVNGGIAPSNVWIGTSVEDQQRSDERIPELLKIPANVRFLSLEPLLGEVDLACVPGYPLSIYREASTVTEHYSQVSFKREGRGLCKITSQSKIDWVIVGGESGPKARPCNIGWIRSVVKQCEKAGVPCFVKQLGSNPVDIYTPSDSAVPETVSMTLKHPKGGDLSEWPCDLRVRQFPSVERKP